MRLVLSLSEPEDLGDFHMPSNLILWFLNSYIATSLFTPLGVFFPTNSIFMTFRK